MTRSRSFSTLHGAERACLAALLLCSATFVGCAGGADAGVPSTPNPGGGAGAGAVGGGAGGTTGGGSGRGAGAENGAAGKAEGGAPGAGMSGAGTSGVAGGSGSASTEAGSGGVGGNGAAARGGGTAQGGAAGLGGSMNAGGGSGAGAGGAGKGGANAAGSGGAAGSGPITVEPDALYAAPDGRSGAPATLAEPTTVADALTRVSAGGTIYLRAGRYTLGSTLALGKDGTAAMPITLAKYPLDAERPVFDFSSMAESSSNRGVNLAGDYWHVYGIDTFAAGDNCMFISGSHNIVEFSTFSECADTGLQLGGGAADNLIRNCDSYFNADSLLENADGFAAKLDVGTGNKFVGCRAWNNLDDGWDGYLRPADNVTTTYERCWAIDNGKLKDGSVGAGDGNGFKTGGSDDKDLRHNAVYEQCISAGNVHDGFDHNSNRGSITILNCAAQDNGANINFSTSNIAASLTIKNTLSIGTRGEQSATATDITNNSWQNGLSASASDFVSIDRALLKAPRQADGSLPDVDYLRLKADSALRNAGTDVGLPFAGAAPDIGPFESKE